jgi:PAS domain S-box-containing protein
LIPINSEPKIRSAAKPDAPVKIDQKLLLVAAFVLGLCAVAIAFIFPAADETRLLYAACAVLWLAVFLALWKGVSSSVARDTVLRDAQRAAEQGQARLQSILETAPEAIITIDEKGIVDTFSASAEKLFGYDSSEVVGRNVSMLMPSPYREQHDQYIQRYLTTGERRIIGIGRVVEAQRKDGSIFPMELAVGEVASVGERTFTGFIRDLSARRRMEQELRQAQKMEAVGQLTGGIAHDFNNLLTVIMGNLEMLESRVGKEGRPATWLREAYETAQLGAELTGRLLAFARRQPLRPQIVDVGLLVGRASELLKRTLGESVEVRTVIGDNLYRSLVDPGQLENAILNLGINARDAMPGGGTLTLDAANVDVDAVYAQMHSELREGPYVVIAVTDTGVGMSEEVRERAFEPFFTTKPVGAGTGLGLSMVYGFVKQSGGDVRIYSELDRGTTVRIYLPRAAEDTTASAQSPDSPSPAYPAHGETVLVVEDDARVRRVTVERLRMLGYRVLEAENGPLALEVLAEQRDGIDLLFTDMVMPGGLSGSDLAQEARRRLPEIKILFTTGYAQPDVVRRGLAESANWLNKPYTALDLARKLRDVLED